MTTIEKLLKDGEKIVKKLNAGKSLTMAERVTIEVLNTLTGKQLSK